MYVCVYIYVFATENNVFATANNANYIYIKSETRMIASVLKQDPNI